MSSKAPVAPAEPDVPTNLEAIAERPRRLVDTELEGCLIRGTDLSGMDAKGLRLIDPRLTDVDLTASDLTRAGCVTLFASVEVLPTLERTRPTSGAFGSRASERQASSSRRAPREAKRTSTRQRSPAWCSKTVISRMRAGERRRSAKARCVVAICLGRRISNSCEGSGCHGEMSSDQRTRSLKPPASKSSTTEIELLRAAARPQSGGFHWSREANPSRVTRSRAVSGWFTRITL
jgi:hypothetical protein